MKLQTTTWFAIRQIALNDLYMYINQDGKINFMETLSRDYPSICITRYKADAEELLDRVKHAGYTAQCEIVKLSVVIRGY